MSHAHSLILTYHVPWVCVHLRVCACICTCAYMCLLICAMCKHQTHKVCVNVLRWGAFHASCCLLPAFLTRNLPGTPWRLQRMQPSMIQDTWGVSHTRHAAISGTLQTNSSQTTIRWIETPGKLPVCCGEFFTPLSTRP